MVAVVRTAHVNAAPPAVWMVLSDFAAISRWAGNVDHSCLMTDQAEGVGSVRRIQTSGATVVETVTVWDPHDSLSYRITGLPPVIKEVTNTWRLEPSGDGTSVSLTTEIDAGPRPPQKLVARAVGRRFARASEEMAAGLKRHVERAVSRPAQTQQAPRQQGSTS